MSRITLLFEGDGSDRWAREVTIHEATGACMHARGFEYGPIRWTKEQIIGDAALPVHRPLPPSSALSEGYGPAPSVGWSAPDEALVELSREAQAAEVSCIVAAYDVAFADFGRYEALRQELEDLRFTFFQDFSANTDVTQLKHRWSSCMADADYEFAEPAAAHETAWESMTASAASQLAVADARCRKTTDFDRRYWALFESAEAAFILDNETLIWDVYEARYGEPRP